MVFRGIPNGILGSLKSSLPEVHAAIEQFIPHSLTKQSFASLLADYQRLKLRKKDVVVERCGLFDANHMPAFFFAAVFLF